MTVTCGRSAQVASTQYNGCMRLRKHCQVYLISHYPACIKQLPGCWMSSAAQQHSAAPCPVAMTRQPTLCSHCSTATWHMSGLQPVKPLLGLYASAPLQRAAMQLGLSVMSLCSRVWCAQQWSIMTANSLLLRHCRYRHMQSWLGYCCTCMLVAVYYTA